MIKQRIEMLSIREETLSVSPNVCFYWAKTTRKTIINFIFLKCVLIYIESIKFLFKGKDIEIDDIHQTSAKFTCSLYVVDTCNAQSLNLSCIIVNKQNLNEENVVLKEQTKK